MCPSPNPYALHAQSPRVDQFRDSYHHYPYYAHLACSNYQSSDHDVNSYPYYVISDEGFVRLNDMIETLNEQNVKFESYLQENHLLHEIDLSLPSSRREVSLCDDASLPFP